jgi:phage head maturation protease
MSETKQIHLKDASITESGIVKAVFATLGVVDHDGDIILSGSIPNGAPVRMSAYNHASWQYALPVGKGTISEVGNELIFDGQFFLDTTDGADTYKTVKGLGDLVEWSFGFDILEKDSMTDPATNQEVRRLKRLNVTEVSPVLLGAGINTRTLAVKSLRKDQSIYKAKIAGIQSEAETKGDAPLAKAAGVLLGLLEEEADSAESMRYEDHAEMVLDMLGDFVKRSQSIAELRTEKGKEPASSKNRDALKSIAGKLSTAAAEIVRIAETNSEADNRKARDEFARLLANIEAKELMEA